MSIPEIDKNALYGRYQSHEDRRARLGMKAAHKALDIPDDDMQINVDKSKRGVGPLGVVGAALAGGVPAAAIAALALMRGGEAPAAPAAPMKPAAVVAKDKAWDAVYEEQQADGTWKEVRREHLPTK